MNVKISVIVTACTSHTKPKNGEGSRCGVRSKSVVGRQLLGESVFFKNVAPGNCPFFQDYEQRSFIQDYGHHKSDLIGLKKEENENLEQNGSGEVERGRTNVTEMHCTTFTKLIKRQKINMLNISHVFRSRVQTLIPKKVVQF